MLLLAMASSAQAQPSVSASVSPAQITPGGSAVFTITVANGRPSKLDAPPSLPEGVELLEPTAEYREAPVQLGGSVQMALTMNWRITCQNEGSYLIPPQEIEIRGDIYTTKPVKLVVKDDPNSPSSDYDPILSLEAGKTEFYEGEVVPLTANLYIHGRTMLRRPGLIELPKENFAVQRFPLQPDEESVQRIGGVPYRANIFHSTVSALKPGKFKLGPATCEVLVDVQSSAENFTPQYFSQMETRKFKVKSSEVALNVLPLPKDNKPGTFSGAVGEFAIGLVAEPLEVNVGDPISVELSISGSGNFDSVSVPTLTDPKNWKLYPPRKFQPNDGIFAQRSGSREQRVSFTQIILPNKVVKEIPPFEFTFFSPTKKQYVVLTTQPVPIKVKGPATPEAPPAGSGTAATTKESTALPPLEEKKPVVKAAITDILTNTPRRAMWFAASLPLKDDRRFLMANFIATGALLFIIAMKLGLMAWRSYTHSPDAPTRALWKGLHDNRLSRADFYTRAVHYAAVTGVAGTAVPTIVYRQEELNYARQGEEASQPVPRDERNRVLHVLKCGEFPAPQVEPATVSLAAAPAETATSTETTPAGDAQTAPAASDSAAATSEPKATSLKESAPPTSALILSKEPEAEAGDKEKEKSPEATSAVAETKEPATGEGSKDKGDERQPEDKAKA
ncbi:BatD family protein [Roseimicrobium gellanilyticum]|nr:BatD family protein [Roseimicrobium gellanilyticum]